MNNAKYANKRAGSIPHAGIAYWILLFLPLAFGLIYLIMACTIPAELCPDEHMRYDVPLFIFQHGGALPNGWDPEIRNPIWGLSYAFNVYGSSLVAALFMGICGLFSTAPTALFIAARMSSVFFSVCTLYICVAIGRIIFERSPLSQILLVVLVGLLPQFAFISSYFNCDAMNVFCTSLIFLCLFRGMRYGWRLRDAILLAIALGICALSYYYAYGMFIVSIVMYYASCLTNPRNRTVKHLLGFPLLIIVVALLVCGWFFIHNALLYDGDFFGMKASSLSSEMYAQDGIKPSQRQTPRSLGGSLLSLFTTQYFDSYWLESTMRSFVGQFGYMNIFMPWVCYWAYAAIIAIGFVLFWVRFIRQRAYRNKSSIILLVGLLLSMAIPFALSLYYSWSSDFQAQGRYLFSGLIGLMILIANGWSIGAPSIRIEEMGSQDHILGTCPEDPEPVSPYSKKPWGAMVISVIWAICFIIVFIRVFIPECLLGITMS